MEIVERKPVTMTFWRKHLRPERIIHQLIDPTSKPDGAVGKIFRIDRVDVQEMDEEDRIVFHLTEFTAVKEE